MSPPKAPARLLIAEDDADIRELLKHYLKDFATEIYEAENGHDALELVKRNNFHAILSDIDMPIMDGLKFLAYLRSLGQMTPFVVLTAHGDHEKALECFALGAFDFISKDSKRNVVLESVRLAIDLGQEIISHQGDPARSHQLRKTYLDIAKSSEVRLRKLIEELDPQY